jgi:tripartite-type tricarboxylate transporter receptor subunit TctC
MTQVAVALWFTRGMDATPAPPPSLAKPGERATVAPGGWLRDPLNLKEDYQQPATCPQFSCLTTRVQSTGDGGNIGTEAVVGAPADGYTLLMVGIYNASNATLYDRLSFDFIRDIAPVAGVFRGPSVLVVNPSVPAKSVSEFIAYAKANPGKVNIASAGIGTGTHMAGELFQMMTGVKMVHVPYRGGAPAFTNLLAGQVQVYFPVLPAATEYIRAGKLRALAVTSATRSESLPDIPTVAEFLPGYEASNWYGLGAPRNTPVEIVDKLNKEINAGLANPKIKARLADLGSEPLSMMPSEFGKLIADETEKWAKVIRAANIKPE